jgi:hypothetical protein
VGIGLLFEAERMEFHRKAGELQSALEIGNELLGIVLGGSASDISDASRYVHGTAAFLIGNLLRHGGLYQRGLECDRPGTIDFPSWSRGTSYRARALLLRKSRLRGYDRNVPIRCALRRGHTRQPPVCECANYVVIFACLLVCQERTSGQAICTAGRKTICRIGFSEIRGSGPGSGCPAWVVAVATNGAEGELRHGEPGSRPDC